ncbi:hypothetical protein LBMAG56_25290 [Verrucomicrobiota bacterium]|nr:hypothetical protein LBMAG56_25290 [Verrucomicrobiota bacterium]
MPASAVNPSNLKPFLQACLVELALLALAALAAGFTGRAPLADLHWNLRDACLGTAATLPPLAAFFWTLKSPAAPFARIRQFLDHTLLPLMRNWSLWQLALISAIAGVSEEALFRGFLQGWLRDHLGFVPALLLASAAFGFAHPITLGYALVVGIIGLYLGQLWELTGNLLTPIITHALYDFAALVWYLRTPPRPSA